MKRGKIGAIIVGVVIIAGAICTIKCIEKVPAGYVGVEYRMNGGIVDKTLSQGWHIVAPTIKVTNYTVGIEQSYLTKGDKGDSEGDDSFSIPTKDGKTVNVDLEFSYRFDPDRLPETFTMFKGKDGEAIKNTFIKPKMIAWSQEVTSKYPVTAILGDERTQINEELDTYLKKKFDKYGIIIDTVNFTSIRADKETKAAIQKKISAQQELETAQVQAQTAEVEAEKDRKVAEVNAETKRIKAQAEADANAILNNSLTENVLRQEMIDKWDGKLPTYDGTGATSVILGQ